jgi:hypothetical protein
VTRKLLTFSSCGCDQGRLQGLKRESAPCKPVPPCYAFEGLRCTRGRRRHTRHVGFERVCQRVRRGCRHNNPRLHSGGVGVPAPPARLCMHSRLLARARSVSRMPHVQALRAAAQSEHEHVMMRSQRAAVEAAANHAAARVRDASARARVRARPRNARRHTPWRRGSRPCQAQARAPPASQRPSHSARPAAAGGQAQLLVAQALCLRWCE